MKALILSTLLIIHMGSIAQTDTCDFKILETEWHYVCDRSGGTYTAYELQIDTFANAFYDTLDRAYFVYDYGASWAGSFYEDERVEIQIPFGKTSTVYVYDSKGCVQSRTHSSDSGITAKTIVTDVSCHACQDGEIRVQFTGGDSNQVSLYRWNDSNMQITKTAMMLSTGAYNCTIYYGDDCHYQVGDTVDVTTSIQEPKKIDFLIGPNPFANHLTFSLPKENNANKSTFRLFDSSGKMVVSFVPADNRNVLDVSHLTPGIYTYQVVTEQEIQNTGSLAK